MLDAEAYLSSLISLLRRQYGPRLVYVGLQGSYLRGEATERSDLDVMVVVEDLGVADLDAYREAIRSLGDFERSCGFICGREELACWNPLEICHLLHTTKDYYGALSGLVPPYTREDIRGFVKISVNNLYHELCHRYVHASPERNTAALPETYKGVFFILQNLHYLETGAFFPTKALLLPRLTGTDKAVLETAIRLRDSGEYDFAACYGLLFSWCRETIRRLSELGTPL